MQLFGRGVRRRLAPMLGGDGRRIRLAYSLQCSMPGTPVIRRPDTPIVPGGTGRPCRSFGRAMAMATRAPLSRLTRILKNRCGIATLPEGTVGAGARSKMLPVMT